MTIGIYSLTFVGTEDTYIGQSSNIERRFSVHKSNMHNSTHYNSKIQQAYNTYGEPLLSIIEECPLSQLTINENKWITKLNTICSGLNISSPTTNIGPYYSNSKYSILQVLKVFRYSYLHTHKDLNYKQIALLTNTSEGLVNDIRSSRGHLWLSEKYPYQYSLMRALIGTRNGKLTGEIYTLVSPKGEIHTLDNVTKFFKENGLDRGHLHRVIHGKAKSHKGWTKP